MSRRILLWGLLLIHYDGFIISKSWSVFGQAEASSFAGGGMGLDAATLRALGIEEGDLEEGGMDGDDEDEDVLMPLSGFGSEDVSDEEEADEKGEEEDSSWWRNPLAQFADEGEDGGGGLFAIEEGEDMLEPIGEKINEEMANQRNKAEKGESSTMTRPSRINIPSLLRRNTLVEKNNGSDAGAKNIAALKVSTPLTMLIPAILPKFRNLLGSALHHSPIMKFVMSLVAAQYAITFIMRSKDGKSERKADLGDGSTGGEYNKSDSKNDGNDQYFNYATAEDKDASPDQILRSKLASANVDGYDGYSSSPTYEKSIEEDEITNDDIVEDDIVVKSSSDESNRMGIILSHVSSQAKALFRRRDPNAPTIESLTEDLHRWKQVAEEKEAEKASIFREREEMSVQVRHKLKFDFLGTLRDSNLSSQRCGR